ncbi:MAG: energy-coupling factor ABC transporter permease [Verrucomicrobiia bacterium]
MHIPDGFLDAKTTATTAVLAVTGVGLALRQVRHVLPPRQVPLLGLSAAFLFAAQMLNFPVVAGTSGHLIGGVLVAALLGPSAATVVVTAVLIVQSFLFQDGGVLALGANVFNMAILGAGGGWLIYRGVHAILPGAWGRLAAVAFAGWASTLLAAMGCAGQLAWSDRVPWSTGFTAMVGVHLFIGLGEGAISALVFAAIQRTRPDLTQETALAPSARGAKELVGYGLMVSLGLALFVAPLASPWPDGLEAVAERLGFAHLAKEPPVPGLAPDYEFPGTGSPALATSLAGAIGSVVVFGLAILLARALVAGRAAPDAAKRDP